MAKPRYLQTGTATKVSAGTTVAAAAMLVVGTMALATAGGLLAVLALRQTVRIAAVPGGGGAAVAEQPDPRNIGPQRFIVVSAYERGTTPITFGTQQILDIIANGENSVAAFWHRNSYNQVQLVGMDGGPINNDDVFGPFAVDLAPYVGSDCGVAMARATYDAAFAAGVPFTNSLRVILLTTKSCGVGGDSFSYDFGTPERPLVLRFAAEYALTPSRFDHFFTTAHEVGHQLGLGHARYHPCLPDPSVSPDVCDVVNFDEDHANPYDVMGRAKGRWQSGARMLQMAGWILDNPEAPYRVVTAMPNTLPPDGTYYVQPVNSDAPGVKALRIPHGYTYRPAGDTLNPVEYLYVEWFAPAGPESEIPALYGEYQPDIFDGALLTVTVESNPTLIHPLAVDKSLGCSGTNFGDCPRSFRTALPFGQAYTDPNTATRIRLGPKPAAGEPLAVTVEHLGRTDFEPPENLQFTEISRPDACTILYEASAIDASGISTIEVHLAPRDGQELTITGQFSPFQVRVDMRQYHQGSAWLRVFDNAKIHGGVMPNLWAHSSRVSISNVQTCDVFGPRIVVRSPALASAFDTDVASPYDVVQANPGQVRTFGFSFPAQVQSPLPLDVLFSDSSYLNFVNVDEWVGFSKFDSAGYPLDGTARSIYHIYLSPQSVSTHQVERVLKLEPGVHYLTILGEDVQSNDTYVNLRVEIAPPTNFSRGDTNDDSTVMITDAIRILSYLFLGGVTLDCLDAADVDDSGFVDIGDATRLLNYLYLGNVAPPPSPFGSCGDDPTPDSLRCGSFPSCAGG